MVSGLRNKIYFPFASFNPWLQALAKPIFSLLAINRTAGKSWLQIFNTVI